MILTDHTDMYAEPFLESCGMGEIAACEITVMAIGLGIKLWWNLDPKKQHLHFTEKRDDTAMHS